MTRECECKWAECETCHKCAYLLDIAEDFYAAHPDVKTQHTLAPLMESLLGLFQRFSGPESLCNPPLQQRITCINCGATPETKHIYTGIYGCCDECYEPYDEKARDLAILRALVKCSECGAKGTDGAIFVTAEESVCLECLGGLG